MISVWKGYAVRSRQGVARVFEDGEQDLVFGTDRALNRARDFRYTDSAAITSWDFGRPEAQKDGLGMHFDRPAECGIGHLHLTECIVGDGPDR